MKALWNIFTSPRTSWAGVGAIVVAGGHLVAMLAPGFDGDAATHVDWNRVSTAFTEVLIALGLTQARDNKKTSEEVGAK